MQYKTYLFNIIQNTHTNARVVWCGVGGGGLCACPMQMYEMWDCLEKLL